MEPPGSTATRRLDLNIVQFATALTHFLDDFSQFVAGHSSSPLRQGLMIVSFTDSHLISFRQQQLLHGHHSPVV